MKIELPPKFIQTIENAFHSEGRIWMEAFPALLEEASQRWDLTDIQPVSNLSYNFVAVARSGATLGTAKGKRSRSAGRTIRPSTLRQAQDNAAPRNARGSAQDHVILKLGIPNRELTSEIAALRFYNGQGACRLLDADAEKGMLLLERLKPGRMLATLEDDERATEIAAEVMLNLWKSSNDFPGIARQETGSCFRTSALVPAVGAGEVVPTAFIRLKDWFSGFRRLRQQFNGGTGPMPKLLVETAEALSRDLLAENKDETLLHGDFHHYNVLESPRGWLAIDPKGVIGPRGYEVGPFLTNPVDRFFKENNPTVRTERRIAILSETLGMERERIRAWGICHAVLSAWWSIEDNEPGWGGHSLRCADIFKQLGV